MLQGSVASEYVACHETLSAGVERLQGGPPIVHRLTLPLAPGRWFISATLMAGLANISVSLRLEGGGGAVKTLGGVHNGTMNPHFAPALVMVYFDDVVAAKGQPVEIVALFEASSPTAVAVVGQRILSLTAWKRAEPAAVAAPAKAAKPAPAPAPKPVAKPVVEAKAPAKPAPAEKAPPPKPAPAPEAATAKPAPAAAAEKQAAPARGPQRAAAEAKPAPKPAPRKPAPAPVKPAAASAPPQAKRAGKRK